jgi:acyl-[acyl-carrier-protein]-phospholipid O-acyltransferase/long-chain-fatty-acid--[acyl-carrier-protein] ligase
MPTLSVPFPTNEYTTRGLPLPPFPSSWKNIVKAIVRQARKHPNKIFAYDNFDGTILTFKNLVERSVGASRIIGRIVGEGHNIGILLPPSSAGAIANLAVAMSGNTIIDLNILSEQLANSVVADAKAEYVITSRAFLEKVKNLNVNAKYLYLEDFPDLVTTHDRLRARNVSTFMPLTGLSEILPGAKKTLRDTAALMYTSGSTGTPKGAELSHKGILANIWQIKHHMGLKDDAVLLSALPFFHSFGFTVTLFAVMVLGLSCVFQANPRDGEVIANELIPEHKITMILGTPTLVRLFWLKHMTEENTKTIDLMMLGSEPLKPELERDIKEKTGIVARQGYGTTEFSPGVTANRVGKVTLEDGRVVEGTKSGSVGLPFPDTYIAIVDEETGEVLTAGHRKEDGSYRSGLIFVKGPQCMKGYFNRQEETGAVLKNGWYYTADIGYIDEDGFLFITGRAGRRIKIGAEMVPLLFIEAAIAKATGLSETDFVTEGVPDETKGERLVLLYTTLGKNADGSDRTPSDVVKLLKEMKLATLWIPNAKDCYKIDAMPINPTGKLDLKAVKTLALEKSGAKV